MSSKEVNLNLEEENSLEFEIEIQSNTAIGKTSARLMCEADDIGYSFKGEISGKIAKITIPPMLNKIKEGSYPSRLEIFIDEKKYFSPIEFSAKFIRDTKINANIKPNNNSQLKESVTAKVLSNNIKKDEIVDWIYKELDKCKP